MERDGWISIHRKLLDNPIWKKKPFDLGHAWVDILLHCNHKPDSFMIDMTVIKVDRGQTAMSIKSWAKRWGWHESKVRRFFKTLESELMIAQKATNKTTILTVLNYDAYQVQPTTTSTINRRSTDDQPTTNNNDNKNNTLFTIVNKNGKPVPPDEKNGNTLTKWFGYMYEYYMQTPYTASFGRDGKIMKDLYQHRKDELLGIVDHYLSVENHPKHFWTQKPRTIPNLRSFINDVVQHKMELG